ncbi:uncharacterized protein G2W53_015802 [Senna tora]|uniref:Uncharacterized protein n=1 Tax=Senna tora TaxID=362788 RepID=A0A834WW05_9FABA|nr:uncharacterized protein G2W53_015802 [Senna tora]
MVKKEEVVAAADMHNGPESNGPYQKAACGPEESSPNPPTDSEELVKCMSWRKLARNPPWWLTDYVLKSYLLEI